MKPHGLSRRAAFVAEQLRLGYGTEPSADRREARSLAERRLQSAAERYQRDRPLGSSTSTYDQLILARCLAHFAERPPRRLEELISLAHYPGGVRFIGLGQLPPEALRCSGATAVPVSDGSPRAGQSVWSMLRSPDPRPLAATYEDGNSGTLRNLAGAVRRHCQELS